jgi:hypothetical protein
MPRRIRSFPMYFKKTGPTRFSPGTCEVYFADEWAALQKSRQLAQTSNQPPDNSIQANVEPAPLNDSSPTANDPPAQLNSDNTQSNTASAILPEPANLAVQPADPIAASPRAELGRTKPRAEWCRAQSRTEWGSTTPSISSTPSPRPPDFARHARRCAICSHPDRDAIEGDFIRWRSPELIAKEFHISDRSTIYRHVHSTGLLAWRKRELARVLEGILESAEHVPLTSSDVIIRAARIYSHLDDSGNWFDPARTSFVLTGPLPPITRPEIFEQSNSRRAVTQKVKKSNRNSRQIKKSVKRLNPKEKANS